jgi:tRNA (guanine-N7-)-methyltransferase
MRLRRTLETAEYLIEPEQVTDRLELAELFGRSGPFELEIGSGKGTFLIQEGRARPEVCLLGVEYMKKYAAYAADRLRRAELGNARIVAGDAVAFLRERLPDGVFDAVHVYFPDPWPKARHHKRRLVRPDVLPELERVLASGGELRIVTDHPEYAEWIGQVLVASTLERTDYRPPASAGADELVGTNFERKYKARDGRPGHAFALRKR